MSDVCVECIRPIERGRRGSHHGHGLCSTCYARHERRRDTPWAVALAAKRRATQAAFVRADE